MKKQTIIAVLLFILLTTIIPNHKTKVVEFNLQEIEINNNFLIKDKELKSCLAEFTVKILYL